MEFSSEVGDVISWAVEAGAGLGLGLGLAMLIGSCEVGWLRGCGVGGE